MTTRSCEQQKVLTMKNLQVFMALILVTRVAGSSPLDLILPKDCNSTEVYDSSLLRCESCLSSANYYQREANETIIKVKKNAFQCTCPPGHYSKHEVVTEILTTKCYSCSEGQKMVVSLDGLSCATCQATFDVKSSRCFCSSGILVEVEEDGQLVQKCSPCVGFTRFNGDTNTCVPCDPTFIRRSGRCDCPKESHREESGLCIPRKDLIAEKSGIFSVYVGDPPVAKRSIFIGDHLQAASYDCRFRGNRTSCQLLGNLCVLIHYSYSNTISHDLSNACMEYRKLFSGSHINQNVWPDRGPWLYYNPDTRTELKRTNVPNNFGVRSKVKILAFRFNALGTLVDASYLAPNELQVCPDALASAGVAFNFGTNVHHECQIPAREIFKGTPKTPQETIFYDLYLVDEETKTMYPIPILNLQLEKNREKVNDLPGDPLQLVRRFFVKEAISVPGVVRVIQSIDIDMNIRRDADSGGSIYPPLISISYRDVTEEDIKGNRLIYTSFKVTYWMSQKNVERDVSITLSVLSSVAIIWSLLKTWTWVKRDGRLGVDLIILGKFIIISLGYLANVFLIVAVGCCINWFVLFKKQSVVHTMLPTPEQEYSVWIYLVIALPIKFLQLTHDLIIICSADLFFIDWERPKSRQAEWPQLSVIRAAQSKAVLDGVTVTGGDGKESGQEDDKETAKRPGKGKPFMPSSKSGVSVWRSIFVANEWLELFGYRRIATSVHFILLIFCMKVLNFEEAVKYTNLDEDSEKLRHVPDSLSCRIAVGSLVYGCLLAIQWVIMSGIYERYFKDRLKEFVDVCSVANVSVFIWLHSRYGYYIHGRSPHGRAEVDMKQMHLLLQREENDLCSRRGLVPNTDQQTFEMSLPPGMYDHYLKMRSLLAVMTTSGGGSVSGGSGMKDVNDVKRLGRITDVDKIIPSYFMMTKFYSSFIDHSLKDFEYIVRDKTTLEYILDAEFDERRDIGYLYSDNGLSFERVLLSGNESTIIFFEFILFLVVDIIAFDYVLSSAVTFVIMKIIQGVSLMAARRNLVSKAFIDERFLI